MNHASKNTPPLNHDTTSTFSSAQHQPLTMAPKPTTLLDHDTQVYYFKQYRQFWASGPAAAVAVIAGVSSSDIGRLNTKPRQSPLENLKTRMQS